MTPFIQSNICLIGLHCAGCRNREGGRAARRAWGNKFSLPAAAGEAPEDFECPKERGARGWGWKQGHPVPVAVRGKPSSPQPIPYDRWPRRVKLVARMRREGEKGIGDTLARMIGKGGGDKLAKLFTRVTGKDCGCGDRKARLNRDYPY